MASSEGIRLSIGESLNVPDSNKRISGPSKSAQTVKNSEHVFREPKPSTDRATKNKFYVGETATQRKRRLEKKRQKYRDKLLSETKAEKRLRLEERRDKRKAESTEQRGVRLYRDRQRKRLGRSETLEQIQRGKFQMTPNQLKKISLDENGTFMSDFDPERSKREMRKLNRKIHKENKKLNQMYDETGRLLENSLDICDCLDKDCPGCHFPCPKCASEKCGAECRSGRRWTYEQVEVEGTNLVFKWSSTTAS